MATSPPDGTKKPRFYPGLFGMGGLVNFGNFFAKITQCLL